MDRLQRFVSSLASARAFRLLVTISILALILFRLDYESLGSLLATIHWKIAALPLLVLAIQLMIGMLRWGVVLRDRGIALPRSEIATYYLASIAAGVLLPTQLGGESVRMYHLYKGRAAGVNSFSSIIYERSIGLGTLTLIGAVASLFVIGRIDPLVIWLALAMFVVAATGIYTAVYAPFTPRLVGILSSRWSRGFLASIWSLLRSLHDFRSARLLGKTFGLSLLFQGTNVALVYLNAKVLGLALPGAYFLVLVPLIGVLVMLPISVAGLGLREYLYIAFFGSVGLPAAAGFSLSILLFAETLLLALPGAIFLLFPAATVQPEYTAVPVSRESAQDPA